jgi:hypothetical protein
MYIVCVIENSVWRERKSLSGKKVFIIKLQIVKKKERENFFPHYRIQNGSGAHPASYPIGIKDSFPGCKAVEA